MRPVAIVCVLGLAAWVATQIAANDSALAFLALVSAPMESPEVHRLRARGLDLLEESDLAEPIVDRIVRFESARWDYLETGTGYDKLVAELGDLRLKEWFGESGLPDRIRTAEERLDLPDDLRVFLDQRRLDPLELITRIPQPILALYGDQDTSMPATEFAVKLHFLAAAMDLDLTVRTYGELGHALITPENPGDGLGSEVLGDLQRWMSQQIDSQRTAAAPACQSDHRLAGSTRR